MATKANPQDQHIVPKDVSHYNNIYNNIEKKLYRKAISTCDILLKSYPTNGEVTAAKGMALASIAQRGDDAAKDAGVKLMKQGLMWNLKSPKSWHMQGLYYRNDKQYVEALKSYQQVLKLTTAEGNTPSNEFLRDLSTLQAQTGKWDDFVETRRTLVLNANFPQLHWPGFAVGLHLAGRPNVAVEALNNYQQMVKTAALADTSKKPSFEESELCLYRCEILYQKGDYQTALDNLIANEASIIDIHAMYLYKIRIMIKLGKMGEARELILGKILAQNNEHLEAIILFFHSHNVSFDSLNLKDADQYAQIRALFTELLTTFPKSSTILQLSLQYYNETDLKAPLECYVKPNLAKGVPSLFKTLKSLYKHKEIVQFVEQLLLSFVESLTKDNTFPNDSLQQTPTTLLSSYIYLAQHFDYLGQVDEAFEYLNLAEKHTPTFIDLYVYRAKIFKHAGNHLAAYHWMDYARSLDLADRWLNNKTAMYAYQCGLDDQGDRTIKLFITDKCGIHVYQYHEQASWWFFQSGLCHLQHSKHYPLAIKSLASIDDFFTQYQESVYDYHQYTVRKCLLRAYSGMVTYLNGVKTHKFFLRGVLPLLNTLVTLHFQVQFEKSLVSTVAQTDAGKAALVAQEKVFQTSFETRDQGKWRVDYLTRREAKKKKASDAQTDDTETENAGATAQNPHYDIYGLSSFKSQFIDKIVTKSDFNVFIVEAQRYIDLILDHFNKAKSEHAKSSNVSEAIGNTYQNVPPAVYLQGITASVETAHPLRALKYYNQAIEGVEEFTKSVQVDQTSLATADQIVKKQYAGGFSWYQLQGTAIGHKIKLLPHFYEASLFVAKAQISQLCANETLATSSMVKTEKILTAYQKQYTSALEKGLLAPDVKALIVEKIQSIASASTADCFAKRIIGLAGAILAAYYTKTSIDFATIQAAFESITSALPAGKKPCQITRTALSSLVYVINMALGNTYFSHVTQTVPIITGFVETLSTQQCTPFDQHAQTTLKQILQSVQTYAKNAFPHDVAFMNAEELQQNTEKYKTTGPDFVAPRND